ncbi:hypothetical protein PVL29_013778 [Vitis rotundifolia]|uniref:RNA helicase n=1 Tax=Vitis rotundifolia TaxID=103349 RepID=A0AA38ZMR0_VITRO|nr:hypothetical protein PVL29_013778 [Vitis rotundifolia]
MATSRNKIVWLRWLLTYMGVPITTPILHYCDNKSAIQIACNSVIHERIKHIDIDYHSTWQELQCGMITLPFVFSSIQKTNTTLVLVYKGCFALVTKVARMLAAKTMKPELEQKSCTVMALLDGGMLKRHISWLKAEPPTIVVATVRSSCQMLEKQIFKLESMRVLVIDEVDFMFNSSKQVGSLRKLLASYSSTNNRQIVFASASIPSDVVHVHVNPIEPMPSSLHHRFVICDKYERRQTLLSLLHSDAPECGIIFVGEQVNAAYYSNSGNAPSATLFVDFLTTSYGGPDILLLEEDMNFNLRAASLSEVRQRGGYLLISIDIAAKGVDLPETTHIYNFDLPRTVVDYLH